MNDIYQSPTAELRDVESSDQYGSIAKAIAGDYEFSVGGILSEAWSNLKGCKTNIHIALFIYFLACVVAIVPITMLALLVGEGAATSLLMNVLSQVLVPALAMPIFAGVYIIAIKHSLGLSHTVGEVFSHYSKTIPLVLTSILMSLLITIGFLFLILPGIYLMFAYIFAIPLVVEKGLGPWQALEVSRKAVTKNWFGFFALAMILLLINIAGTIPLTIGLIWTVPLSMLAYGIAYRNMFGYEQR